MTSKPARRQRSRPIPGKRKPAAVRQANTTRRTIRNRKRAAGTAVRDARRNAPQPMVIDLSDDENNQGGSARAAPTRTRRNPRRIVDEWDTCDICGERVTHGETTRLPCEHVHCHACLADNVAQAIATAPFAPARCCDDLPPAIIRAHAGSAAKAATYALLLDEHRDKAKLYCHVLRCSAYIPGRLRTARIGSCESCGVRTCVACQAKSHFGPCRLAAEKEGRRPSPEDRRRARTEAAANLEKLMALADKKLWKSCPRCKNLVERISGCDMMTCRCRCVFCYNCGEKYPNSASASQCTCHRPLSIPRNT